MAVAVVTVAVFWPVLGNSFVDLYDDGPYVLQNARVRAGLTSESVAWALTAVHVHNWHPLTWISHMADVQFFGLDPWGHHLTSVLLHGVNAGLVVLVFHALGVPAAAAAFAGAFFGLHPLRLESVAWVAERKDVLSGLLFFVSILAWVRHARSGNRAAYVTSVLAFALGLLAKPMLVTLPAVLLLLDLWPLSRMRMEWSLEARESWKAGAIRLAPFAALSLVVAIITIQAQGGTGSFASGRDLSLGQRIANASTSVFAYLGRMAWPTDLSVFYPHPRRPFLDPTGLAAMAGVIGISLAAVTAWRRAPWLLVGWAWYLVMLLPVLGVLQVGSQGMADRYTYLPGVGILLAGTWAVLAVLRRFPNLAVRATVGAAATAAILGLAFTTRAGAPSWKDSETLFTSARAATGTNALASNALGTIAAGRGQFERAEWFFRESIVADPSFGIPRQNLAAMLLQQGRIAEGWPMALEAVRLDPSNARAHYVVGVGHEMQGRLLEAAAAYEEALRRMPEHGLARRRLAEVRAAAASPARGVEGVRP